jgi:hypothetical protein
MEIRIECCDLCNAPVRRLDKCGMVVELGFSCSDHGGWGKRRDVMPRFSGEVCHACFDEYMKRAMALAEWFYARKGSLTPRIEIHPVDGGLNNVKVKVLH